MLVNKNSGKALDLIAGNTALGAPIRQWSYDYNSQNQRWALLPTEGGNHFKLISLVSGKCACIRDDSTAGGALLHQWDYIAGNTSHQWDLVDAGNGYYAVRNVRSGLVLDVRDWSTADNADVLQWTSTGGANQQWQLRDVGSGPFRFSPLHSLSKSSTSSTLGPRPTAPHRIQLWSWLNGQNQHWRFVDPDLQANRLADDRVSETAHSVSGGEDLPARQIESRRFSSVVRTRKSVATILSTAPRIH